MRVQIHTHTHRHVHKQVILRHYRPSILNSSLGNLNKPTTHDHLSTYTHTYIHMTHCTYTPLIVTHTLLTHSHIQASLESDISQIELQVTHKHTIHTYTIIIIIINHHDQSHLSVLRHVHTTLINHYLLSDPHSICAARSCIGGKTHNHTPRKHIHIDTQVSRLHPC